MQRLGQNHEGYHGERLDVAATLAACRAAARRHGWTEDRLPPADLDRPVFVRPSGRSDATRIYISAGIHGDEPAGPMAALRLLDSDRWPEADLWLIPCLNPAAMHANLRTNPGGVDVNRDYLVPVSAEAEGHVAWLRRQPRFNLTLLLHEDWEAHGFYCYELNSGAGPSLAPAMVAAARQFCPIDDSAIIDGRPTSEPGIIRPHVQPEERTDWPEALWLLVHQTDRSYTLEAPSDWPLEVRVNALVAAVNAALNH